MFELLLSELMLKLFVVFVELELPELGFKLMFIFLESGASTKGDTLRLRTLSVMKVSIRGVVIVSWESMLLSPSNEKGGEIGWDIRLGLMRKGALLCLV